MDWMNFCLGIGTGLIASGIIYLVGRSSPWLRNCLSKEAVLQSEWHWFDSTNHEPIGALDIKQTGSTITGILARSTSTGGDKISRKFTFKGKLYGDQLIGTYEEKNNPRLVSGAIVLKLRTNRTFFYGRSLYLQHDAGEVISPKFIFSTEKQLPDLAKEYLEILLPVEQKKQPLENTEG